LVGEGFILKIHQNIHICKEGPQAMNRDDGSYQLSHAYDRFLGTSSSCRVKNWKNYYQLLLMMKVSDRPKNEHCKNNWLCFDEFLIRSLTEVK